MMIEVRRGGLVESVHAVEAHIVTERGETLFSTSADFRVFPRSAIKPFQALFLLNSGAFQAYNLRLEHLALACASHAGERVHTDIIAQWLRQLSLGPQDLACGPHMPTDPQTQIAMIRQNETPTALHNNCSGKHTGLLCACRHLKISVHDYHLLDHPAQILLKKQLEESLEDSLNSYGIDGCSLPAFQTSFQSLARAFARMAASAQDNTKSNEALILRAFLEHPVLTSGHEKFAAKLMQANPGKVLIKTGAEGVLVASIPLKRMGIIVKARDGADRASQVALDHLLQRFAGLDGALETRLFNYAGTLVGDYRVEI